MLAQRSREVEIIEIGAVKLNENLEIVDDFCQFVRPASPRDQPVLHKLTSIVQDDIEVPAFWRH